MEEKKKNGKSALRFLTEKGFYIVLFICAAVIGVCAWLLWFAGKDTETVTDVTQYTDTTLSAFPEYGDTIDGLDTEVSVLEDTETEETDAAVEEETVSTGQWEDSTITQTVPVPLEEETEETADAAEETILPTELPCVWPVSGEVTFPYAVETLVYHKTMDDWRIHDGIDIAAAVGDKVRSMTKGTVLEFYEDDMYGTTVTIDHGGNFISTYSNLAGVPAVDVGDFVEMGDVIGSVGKTALGESAEVSHLHFSLSLDGESVDPNDYLK